MTFSLASLRVSVLKELLPFKCLKVMATARKTIFSFSKSFEKMVFPKKSHWNMIFLVLSGKMIFFFFLYIKIKMIFLFPENILLFFRHKRKDDLSQKKYLEIWYFLQVFWKDGLFRKLAPEHDLFCNIWKDGIYFFQKIYFSLGGK